MAPPSERPRATATHGHGETLDGPHSLQAMTSSGGSCRVDESSLRRPSAVGRGHQGAAQLLQCLRAGTAEVRQLMLSECDVIFECRVCRALYRALPDFLRHKRNYCTSWSCDAPRRNGFVNPLKNAGTSYMTRQQSLIVSARSWVDTIIRYLMIPELCSMYSILDTCVASLVCIW